MNIFYFYLNLIGMLVWLFPPIRQYGTRFFIFFLMLGFADITGALYTKYFQGSNLLIYIIITAVAYFSIHNIKHLKKYFFYYAFMVIAAFGIFFRMPDMITGSLIILAFHILIMLTLFKDLLNDFFNIRSLNLFLAVLIFYEITTVTKLATLLTGSYNNYIYFGTTTAIQILLGIFFSIFRYDYKRLIFQLR
jgi:hypothetical protein